MIERNQLQIIKAAVVIAVCSVITVFVFWAYGPKGGDSIPAHEFETYTLFTWKGSSSDFCFKIMTRAESHKFIHSWFPRRDAKCDTSELKKALASLPKDSYVLWESWPPKHFDYPPENVVDEIIQFAEAQAIHVELSPALQQMWDGTVSSNAIRSDAQHKRTSFSGR